MTKAQIKIHVQDDKSMDEIYRIAAGNYGLFGVAFFGHKATRAQRAKLNRVWNRIVNVYHAML